MQIIIDGLKFQIDNPNDFIYAKMIASKSLWDGDRIHYMLRFVTPKSIVVDAGAHVGCMTIPFAKKAKRVIAIEPVKQNYERWKINVKLNGLRNCQLITKALSDRVGCKLVIDPTRERLQQNSGATYLIPSANGQIETTTLDSLLANEQDDISLIKYDVEEMELEALNGSKETLRKHKPILYVEISSEGHRNCRKHNGKQIKLFLKDFGYIETQKVGVWVHQG